MAIRFASDCGAAYRRADDRTRTQFNAALFEELLVRAGRVTEARYRAPFDLLFAMPRFEYQCLVGERGFELPDLLRLATLLARSALISQLSPPPRSDSRK
jgi:hypothetical protein